MDKIWNYFDKAYVINLDSRADRMRNVAFRLNALDIEYERFSAVRPSRLDDFTNLGYHGATLSHLFLWQKIQESEHEIALIFEDDALFRNDTNEIMIRVSEQIKDINWDILYLGVVPYSSKKNTQNLRRLHRGAHFHSYAVNKKSLVNMIPFVEASLSKNKKVIDVTISKSHFKKFYVDPILCVQDISPSDTGGSNNRLAEYFKYFPVDGFIEHCPELFNKIKDDVSEYRKLYCRQRLV